MTTWYILPDIDLICFSCSLPTCNDNSPRCPRRLALAAGNVCRRKPALREVQVIQYLEHHPCAWYRALDIAEAIGAPYRSILHVLRKLKVENRVTHTGARNTLRWTARRSP